MKTMKFFRKKNGAARNISLTLSLILIFNMMMPMLAIAYWTARVVTIAAHMETIDVWVPSGTNGVPGKWKKLEVWVPERTEVQWTEIKDSSTIDPIDTLTGNNYFTENKIFVPCPGIPLKVGLKYQSVTSKPEGRLGKGWHHSYEWTLDDQTTNVVIHTADGSMVIFDQGTNGLYQPNEGSNWKLEQAGVGYEATLPQGQVYNFGTNGHLNVIQDVWGNWVECSYGTNGCLETVTHANGRQLVFSNQWDAVLGEWRVESIQVQGGMAMEFNYNTDGQFTQVVEQVGATSHTSSYQYADGYLTNKINGVGFEYTFGYKTGTNGLLNGKGTYLAVDGYYEHEVDYAEDFATDVTYHRRGQEQIYRYSRGWDGRVKEKQGPAESIQNIEQRGVRYAYSTNGSDKIEETLFDDTEGMTWSTWMQHDDAHNLTNLSSSYCTTNPVHQLSIEYDPVWKLPSAVMNADDSRAEIVYTNGSPLVMKSFYSETNSYDTYYSYTTNGLLKALTNANGHVVDLNYDSAGNLIATSAELGSIVTNTYDTLGFVQSSEFLSESGASSGRITQFDHDAKGRVTEIIFADGNTNSYAYNALGYLTNVIDRVGRATDYTYAPTRKLTSVTRYLEQGGSNVPVRVGYDLDKQLNLLSITEPRSRYVESYQLDIQDRVTSVTNIEDQVLSIDYGIGNFVKEINRFDGSTITNTYDNAGRKDTVTYNAGSTNSLTIDYEYYADGLLKGIGDGTSTVSNRYDRLNRLDRSSSYNPAFSLTQHADYDYDPVGNMTQSTVSYTGWPWAFITTTSTYDEAERLKTRDSHIFTYNPDNGRTATVSNTVSGIARSYGYDLMDRVTNITYRTASGSLIRSLGYAYDASSMITNKIIAGGTTSTSSAYEYDTLNRLISETSFATSVPLQETSYSYDLAGNRLSKITNGRTISYTLGTGNRLDSWATTFAIDLHGTSSEPIGTDARWGELWVSNLNVGAGATPQTDGSSFWVDGMPLEPGTNQLVVALHDQAGNMGYTTNTVHLATASTNMQFQYNAAGCVTNMMKSTGESLALEWDERYRLKRVGDPSSFVQYTYDVLGRKSSSTVGSSTEHYLYDGHHVVADLDSARWLKRTYGYGPGIDNILTMTTYSSGNNAAATYHYIKDHQNSVIALTDSSGTVVETYEYGAYGNTQVFDASGSELTASAYGNRYTFQGREIDWDTGLYYFRARWYNPETGRWLSKDPKGIAGGLNLYVAFGNNPVMFVDPFGLEENDDDYDALSFAYGLAGGADLVGIGTLIAIGGFIETGGLSIIGAIPFWIGGGALIWGSIDIMGGGSSGGGSSGGSSSGGSSSGGSSSGGTVQDAVDDFNYYNSGTEEAMDDFYDAIGGGF